MRGNTEHNLLHDTVLINIGERQHCFQVDCAQYSVLMHMHVVITGQSEVWARVRSV